MRTTSGFLTASLVACSALWLAPATGNTAPFDHSHAALTRQLRTFVTEGFVDYAAWKRSGLGALDDYVNALAQVDAHTYGRFGEAEKLAFWINAYNAFTVKLVIAHHPVDSMRSIGTPPGAAWRREFIPIHITRPRDVSLDHIEHDVVRKRFAEPRVHMALVCAARSCPKLRSEAYTATKLEAQLDEQTRAFIGDPSKNRLVDARGKLALSSIFKWFREDFERGGQTLAGFVAAHVDDPAQKRQIAAADIEFLDYDWSLNGN